jgi:hypothetical protein
MPAASKKSRFLPLEDLSNVKWALLDCSLDLSVGSILTVKTRMGVVGKVEDGDEFGLSLCCDNGTSTETCVDFYLFRGTNAGNPTYRSSGAPFISVAGQDQEFCANTTISFDLSI